MCRDGRSCQTAVFTSEPMSPPMTMLALTVNTHTICALYINPLRVPWWYCYKQGIYQTFITISVNGWACLGALLCRRGTLRERPTHFPLQWKGIETFWLHCDLKVCFKHNINCPVISWMSLSDTFLEARECVENMVLGLGVRAHVFVCACGPINYRFPRDAGALKKQKVYGN